MSTDTQTEPDAELKEWFRVSRAANGVTTVSATVAEGSLSAKWAVKTYSGAIAVGVREARRGAREALAALQEAVNAG